MSSYIVMAHRIQPVHELAINHTLRYIVRRADMPSIPPFNESIIAVSLATVNAQGERTYVVDADLKGVITDTDPIGAVIGAALSTIETAIPHGLTTGDYVLIDEVIGNYSMNGLAQVTVTSTTEFTVPQVDSGTYVKGGKIYRVVMNNLPFTFVSGSTNGLYEYLLPANVPLQRGSRYLLWVWDDTGPHADKFIRSFTLPTR